ncbi:permease prefix domain 1-containing protein [Olsenella sp. An270]|uniref:permease prefix domain 1-containing protein n=1 Tax=Olsenella sp. An270 TaxID=1965615 RepID=UPI000B386968|nr:permease prefix domain 1-containing protein [Olsenella sp. An270]OUO59102.1 hypothetical protein B5F73_06565 [Olsenella sp. An270]
MSGRSDIRMYVEHLFEGRTLDAETIELKEEIYGNLTARFDDYVAQGMSEDEAYRRTCEAVTGVEDMLGEKDEPAVDATVVAPAAQPPAPAADPAPAAATAPTTQQKHWPTWAIVTVVVAGVLVAGMIVVTVFNVVSADAARDVSTNAEDSLVVTLEQPTDSTTSTDQQDGTGNRHGAPSQSETGLLAEVQDHSPSELSVYAGTGLGDASRVEEIVRSLPVGGYVSAVTPDAGAGTLEIYYNYQDRDLLAHDDDHVDRALVYDVVALMSTIDGLDQVSLIETEPDDGSYDVDLRVFDRSMVEGVLGTALGPDLLTDDGWNALREQVLSERYCDPIWERAERG